MTSREEMLAALGPTCDALLQSASTDAAVVLAEADADARRRVTQARAEADRRIAAAREVGAGDARVALDKGQRQAQRDARRLLLQTQREVYEELGRQVRATAQQLRSDQCYERLLEGLTAAVRDCLGPQARVTEAPSGGVLGELGARRIDLSLDVLADRALVACPAEVRALWQP